MFSRGNPILKGWLKGRTEPNLPMYEIPVQIPNEPMRGVMFVWNSKNQKFGQSHWDVGTWIWSITIQSVSVPSDQLVNATSDRIYPVWASCLA